VDSPIEDSAYKPCSWKNLGVVGEVKEIGKVGRLRRYPLKSALGEELQHAVLTKTGIYGDRAFAVLDRESGKIASAKRPKLWRSLLSLTAQLLEDTRTLAISLPDGHTIHSNSADIDSALSQLLGRPVSLVSERRPGMQFERSRPEEVLAHGLDADVGMDVGEIGAAAPEGGFYDFAPVHLVTIASLEEISRKADLDGLEAERYRPNIVIESSDTTPFVENSWKGQKLQIGSAVLEIMVPTPRCAVPTLAHGLGLAPKPDVLRAIHAQNRVDIPDAGTFPCLGVYAKVLHPGNIVPGDSIVLADD
jgi:uncharacterized protein YcbX